MLYTNVCTKLLKLGGDKTIRRPATIAAAVAAAAAVAENISYT